jgi:hypothetical protein
MMTEGDPPVEESIVILLEASLCAAERIADQHAAELVAWSREVNHRRAALETKRRELEHLRAAEKVAAEQLPLALAFRLLGRRSYPLNGKPSPIKAATA